MILTAKARYEQSPMEGVTPYIWLRLILEVPPKSPSFFANESLRFAAFAAVSVAA